MDPTNRLRIYTGLDDLATRIQNRAVDTFIHSMVNTMYRER